MGLAEICGSGRQGIIFTFVLVFLLTEAGVLVLQHAFRIEIGVAI